MVIIIMNVFKGPLQALKDTLHPIKYHIMIEITVEKQLRIKS